MDDVKIIAIRAGATAPHKVAGRTASESRWRYGVVYVLADGRTIETTDSDTRKRDAVAYYASLPIAVDNRAAIFDDDGKFIGTRTTIHLFGGVR